MTIYLFHCQVIKSDKNNHVLSEESEPGTEKESVWLSHIVMSSELAVQSRSYSKLLCYHIEDFQLNM